MTNPSAVPLAGQSAEAQTQAYIASIPADVQARSIRYTDGDHWLILWGLVITALVTWLLVRSRVLVRLAAAVNGAGGRPVRASLAVTAAFVPLSWLLELPWNVYTGWWREKSYGLSKQTFVDWFGQDLLSLAVSTVVAALALTGLYALIRKFPKRWWLLGGAGGAVLILVMLLIAPVYIQPLFNKYEPFPPGPARDAIVKLAVDNGVPADKVFVFDGSRQRSVVTANVTGILGSARIAVSDVAVSRASLSEVRAVVGHEIGHYALGHSYRGAAWFALLIMLGFYSVNRLFPSVARGFGAAQVGGVADPAGIPILLFIVGMIVTLAMPISNSLSRLAENEADNFSLRVARDPDGLSSALIKTVEYRKASPGRLEEILFHDHPGVENRVRNAMEWKAAHKQ